MKPILPKYIIRAALCLVPAMLASCTDSPVEPPQGVIEGCIDSDGYPTVMFTASFVDSDDEQDAADMILRWAKVTISDGEQTVTLTGAPDKKRFPPFVYRTFDMKGEPGRTYTVTADYRNFHLKAVSRMPQPPVVEEVKDVPATDCDTLRDVTLRIKAPVDAPAYYHISTRVLPDETVFLPAVLGCVEAKRHGEVVEIPVYRGKTAFSDDDFSPRLPSNHSVLVRVERVEEPIYRFWMNFNETALFGGSVFISTSSSLGGNATGGLGYFSAQGAVTFTLPAYGSGEAE